MFTNMSTDIARQSVCLLLLSVLLPGVAAWGEPAVSIALTAMPGTVRVRPETPTPGAPSAEIACARNEYESFQVVITARGGPLHNVSVEISALTDASGRALPPADVTLYREVCVPLRGSAPRAAEGPGLVPDALTPLRNPYTGEPVPAGRWREKGLDGARFGGTPFDVWTDRNETLWCDVFAAKDTLPGEYAGTLRIRADNAPAAELPVRVTIWNFTLPEGPTHENHFGGVEAVAEYLHLGRDSDEWRRLEERYLAMMAAHRLNPPLPARLHPKPGEDGTPVFDDAVDAQITAFVEQYHLTNIELPRAPFGDPLGADRPQALNFYRAWHAYLERKGWASRAYLYMLDEPNDAEAYERVRQLGAMVREAHPGIRRLVVEQPYGQDPVWGTLDDAIDIWCPLFGFVHEPSVQRVQAQGDAVWSYTALVQTAPPYHPEYEVVKNDLPPFWQIDFPLTSYRIAPWLNRRYGITGLLYWSTVYWGSPERNPWVDPGFRLRWNGDGALFYPGDDAGVEGPIASIRLKNLRDGMEDYEYFVLLDGLGGTALVEEMVRTAVPAWGSWKQEPFALPELRARLAAEIAARSGETHEAT